MASDDIERIFDPNFLIPEGLTNATYRIDDDDEIVDGVDIEGEENESDPGAEDDIVDDDEGGFDIAAPDFIRVIKQTVRTKKGGKQVVDVVLGVADGTTGIKYDVRITKID